MLANTSFWQSGQLPHSTEPIHRNVLHTFSSRLPNSRDMVYSVVAWFPAGHDLTGREQFKVPDQGQCRITWTTTNDWPAEENTSEHASLDHFSTLLDGWLPSDGFAFLDIFLQHLAGRWHSLCSQAEQHLAKCVR